MFPRSSAAVWEPQFLVAVLAPLLFLTACGGNHAPDEPSAPLGSDQDPVGDPSDADPEPADPGSGDPVTSDADPSDGDAGQGDGDALPPADDDPVPEELPRGLAWVRENPMFISALTVVMGPPPASYVDDYYDGFGATAVHLWADGLGDTIAGWAAAGRGDFRYVSWTNSDGTNAVTGELMGGMTAPLPGRIGYQVGDEPGLACDDAPDEACAVDSLREMAEGIAALRARDPDALLFCNFAEIRDIDAVLAHYRGVDADVVSYDFYATGSDAYRALERFRAAGLATRRPYWRYIRGFTYDGRADEAPTDSDLRWDAFSGAVYGYTGHSWFLYTIAENPDLDPLFFTHEDDFAAPPTPAWHTVAQINRELAHLGRALTQLTSTDVRYQPALSFRAPEGTRRWSRGAGGDPYLSGVEAKDNPLLDISVGFFEDDAGEIYVMAQNPSHESGEYPVSWTDTGTLRFSFDFTSAPAGTRRDQVISLDESTGTLVPLALTAQGTLEVTLAAGEVVFWKYDTGKRFAGY